MAELSLLEYLMLMLGFATALLLYYIGSKLEKLTDNSEEISKYLKRSLECHEQSLECHERSCDYQWGIKEHTKQK